MKTRLSRSVAAGVLGLTMALFGSFAATPIAEGNLLVEDDKLDQVTLANGRIFVGRVLEETDEIVKMEVVFRGIKTIQIWSALISAAVLAAMLVMLVDLSSRMVQRRMGMVR